jgi:MoaA/NifB/PqqE/SkfB family radical SAM enzyme
MEENSSATVVLGYKCNNNCIFCVYGKKKGKRNLGEIKESIRNLRKYSSHLMITGGSAFRDDYFKILVYAKNLGFKIHIDHNLRLFANIEFAKKVLEIFPDATFSCSLHSPIPSIHEKITRVKGSWNQTIN